jgi:hypothetical protein
LHGVEHGDVRLRDVGAVCVALFAMRLEIVFHRLEVEPLIVDQSSETVADVLLDLGDTSFACVECRSFTRLSEEDG